MKYDGTTPLQPEVARLVNCSVKSQSKIAQVIKEAKQALGIDAKARVLPNEKRLQIYNYLVKKYSQPDNNASVKTISQTNKPEPQPTVEIISQPDNNKTVEIISQPPVELFSQAGNFDDVRVAFYVDRNGERSRQVISLDGYFINALSSIGVSRENLPSWIQQQVNEWSAFDSKLPITRQVKYLIMREVVKHHSGSDSCFYSV